MSTREVLFMFKCRRKRDARKRDIEERGGI